MARLLRAAILMAGFLSAGSAFAAGGACPSGVPVTGNNCYFIAANGLDTNTGVDETHPWLHAPGMPNCKNTCAGVTPTAGNGFIFRGGDTWHFGNSGASPYTGGTWNLDPWSGTIATCIYESTQTGCIYYGVDKTWFAGASWVRPILTGDNPTSTSLVASCPFTIPNNSPFATNTLVVLAPQSILDNFEMLGVCSKDSNVTSGADDVYVAYFGTGIFGKGMFFLTNVYIHGWTATTTAWQGSNNQPGTLIGGPAVNGLATFDHIVIDGQDSNPGSFAWGTFPSFYHFRDSIIRYTNQGVGQFCHDIHDNIFEHMYNHNPGAGSHTNILECNDDNTGNAVGQPQNTPNVFYNNIVRHDDSSYVGSGQVHLWFCPETLPEYWFNNIVYDVANTNVWDYAGPPIYGCSGTGGQFMFNNTLVGVEQPCHVQNVNHGGQFLTVLNEHLINTPFDGGSTTACTGIADATNKAMSDATATSQGYTTGSPGNVNSNTCAHDTTTPCSPTSSGNSTVGAGGNHQAYCTTLASFSSEFAIGTEAANACKFGTTDGCAYNSITHTMVCPAQTAVARPSSSAWDVGAYQFSGSQAQAPQAPTNLQASVQ
jgi:hypothetical protein